MARVQKTKMLANHLIYFYLTIESNTQVLLADKTKTSNRALIPSQQTRLFWVSNELTCRLWTVYWAL